MNIGSAINVQQTRGANGNHMSSMEMSLGLDFSSMHSTDEISSIPKVDATAFRGKGGKLGDLRLDKHIKFDLLYNKLIEAGYTNDEPIVYGSMSLISMIGIDGEIYASKKSKWWKVK